MRVCYVVVRWGAGAFLLGRPHRGFQGFPARLLQEAWVSGSEYVWWGRTVDTSLCGAAVGDLRVYWRVALQRKQG